MYHPIASLRDLPPPGLVPEHLHLDFKAYKGAGQPEREMAKDVAAFANVQGGAILIGAEHEGGSLQYSPLAPEAAIRLADGYQRAIKRQCRPLPVIDPRHVPMDTGVVVAINVPPYPAPPIGVRSEEHGDAWLFPARRGDLTHFLLPEELATTMDPVYRRKVLQIESIPMRASEGRPCLLHFLDSGRFSKHERGMAIDGTNSVHSRYPARVVEIDAIAGVFVAMGATPSRIVIPLDALRGVWKDESYTEHHVAVRGVLAEQGNRFWFVPS